MVTFSFGGTPFCTLEWESVQPDLSPELTQRCGGRPGDISTPTSPICCCKRACLVVVGQLLLLREGKEIKDNHMQKSWLLYCTTSWTFKTNLSLYSSVPFILNSQINHTHIFGKKLLVMSPTYTASNLLIHLLSVSDHPCRLFHPAVTTEPHTHK